MSRDEEIGDNETHSLAKKLMVESVWTGSDGLHLHTHSSFPRKMDPSVEMTFTRCTMFKDSR